MVIPVSIKGTEFLNRLKHHYLLKLHCSMDLVTHITSFVLQYAVAQLVATLRYKLEGREFDSRWDHWNFSVT